MASADATVILLAVVAVVAVIAAAYFYVDARPQPRQEIIIREGGRGWGRRWYPWGPYYAHLPVRPLLY
ncbi:hypothetical protein EBZ80_22170 [bacterium]|nr:hypothetical protein [bacterium]